jgi:hypothetical protein
MVQFVDTMLDPMTEYKSLSKRLTASGPEFARSLDEATYVVEVQRFAPALADPAVPPPFDWLHAMKAGPPTNALRRWKETHSELWLVPAMIHSNAKDADVPALLEAAAKVPETSPAYDTVNYHSVRLVSESGKADQARAMLDKLLAGKPGPLASVDNAFRGQRLALATSFDDFLRWAPRRPIGIGDESIDPGDVSDAPLLDSDSIDVLNLSTPLQKLAEAAHSSRLPPATAEDVARVALTRAILLGDDAVAASVSPVVAGAHPDWAGDLNAFNEATGVSKRFAASLLIERHSQFRTDVSNMGPDISTWWCAQGPYERRPILLASTVLSPEEKQEAAQQLNRIHGAGPAQAFVAPAVMAWAAAHPADPEIPEAVHRVVEMTRYGCRGIPEINGPISKAAFDLLHRKYPDSEWTKKTPYWFKD